MTKLIFNRLLPLLTISVMLLPQVIFAAPLPDEERAAIYRNSVHYAIRSGNSGSCEGTLVSTGNNKDYAGRDVLTQEQLSTIAKNQPIYEKAATSADIPWQMIAVIHIRESGLGRENPSNGQGIYQFVNKNGGPYPTGPVNDAEFQRQTDFVATFIKGKAASNYDANKNLTQASGPDAIKDTFFSYNGRAQVYKDQAQKLGFDANTQGFEGSPYVVNKLDAQRDPGKNPTGWGQIKTDGGGIEYPANEGYGAYVMYAALAGVQIGGSCDSSLSGPVRQKVVTLAQTELKLWETGKLSPGDGYHKYSQGRNENWCADFVSWIYNQAGYPLKEDNEGNVPAVDTVKSIGEEGGKFSYHESSNYTPKPGDMVIQKGSDISHVMLVASVDGNKMTVIGGNQGGSSGFTTSKVTQYTITGFNVDSIIGYVSPNGE